MEQSILKNYNEELRYLREQGDAFSKRYPKIASRLRLSQGAVEDPLVGRLFEAFAFMSAQVRHKSQDELGPMVRALISLLYPHYLAPIPAMSIMQIQLGDSFEDKQVLATKKQISSMHPDGRQCLFQTCYPLTLWPIHVSSVKLTSVVPENINKPGVGIKSYLRLRLRSNLTEKGFAKLKPDQLRFFISAERQYAMAFYELLFCHLQDVVLTYPGAVPVDSISLSNNILQAVGFAEDEAMLPLPKNSFVGYCLLTEYFAFAEKFLFFDLIEIGAVFNENHQQEIELILQFDITQTELEQRIDTDFLKLGCTPIINLFEIEAEPIRLTHDHYEHHLVPDAHQGIENIEIYAVNEVSAQGLNNQAISCLPYFGSKFAKLVKQNGLYWNIKKRAAWDLGAMHLPGDEVFLHVSLLDEALYDDKISLSARCLCTNRVTPNQLPFGGEHPKLKVVGAQDDGSLQLKCLLPFSQVRYRDNQKITDADLLAHLTINQMSFSTHDQPVIILKELLALYHYDNESDEQLIRDGLCDLTLKRVQMRHPESLKFGFCQGIEFNLLIDECYFPIGSAYLFGCVLEHFIAKACSVNSYTQLVIKDKQRQEIAKWPARLGYQAIL